MKTKLLIIVVIVFVSITSGIFAYAVPEVSLSLKQQLADEILLSEILCPDGKHVLSLRPNDKLACVHPTTVYYLDWQIIHLQGTPFSSVYQVEGTTVPIFQNPSSTVIFDIPYIIKGGTIESMMHNNDANSLLVLIDSSNDGFLTVDVPPKLLDYTPEEPSCNIFTLIHGEEVAPELSVGRNENKIVTLNFTNNDPLIEIIGITWPC